MKRVVLTGATGLIGIAFIQKCIQEQIEILVICHKNSSRNSNIPINKLVTIIYSDLNELNNIKYLGNRPYDVFFHLAWIGTSPDLRNNEYTQMKNIEYTLDAVRLAKKLGCHTFIGAGSQAEYGRCEHSLSPDSKTEPESAYGVAKLSAGQMSRILCNQYGIKHIWTRIFSVYGPFDGKNTMITSTIYKMLLRESVRFTKAEQKWDYLYVLDAVNALYLLALKGKKDKIYCIGSGKVQILKEYIYQIRDSINPNMCIKFGELPYSNNQIMYLQADIHTLVEDTGFKVQVAFSDGIQRTIEWMRRVINEENKYINPMF